MIGLMIDIFENRERQPVVSHIFYGKIKAEAEAVSRAHEKTDSFYRGAVKAGEWKGIPLRITRRWLRE